MTGARVRIFLCTLLLPGVAVTTAVGESLRIERLAAGVYAALQPAENSQNDCNSVVLIGERDVVVIDAPADRSAVSELIDTIGELTELPVRYVINTHWHSDHTQGNQVYRERFGDAIEIVGHRSLVEDVPDRAGAYVEEQAERLRQVIPKAESQLELGLSLGGEPLTEEQRAQQREGIANAKAELTRLEGTRLVPPDLHYDSELTLERGETTVRLLHFVGHTRGDTVVHLPRAGVLVTGDLLDEMPYVGHGFPGSWLEALGELDRLEFTKVVPGHGPVFDGRTQLRLLREYLGSLRDQAQAAVDREQTLEEALAALDLSGYRERLAGEHPHLQRAFDAYAPEAFARAFAEASGEALE